MKDKYRIIVLAVSLVVFCGLLFGCRNGTPLYDKRLTVADSVMHQIPDSALRSLEAIDGKTLTHQADRAYHALLLSQARYRCYVIATSDSLINIALYYYQRHSDETEKLTRAFIYKGAVMEELGEPESAMTYYKRALTVAAPDDHFNQGYIRIRIGRVYRNNMVADSSDITMYKEGLSYFKMVPDTFYILTCLSEIGSSYVRFNSDSMMHYLEQAEELAMQLNEDRQLQTIQEYMADRKMFSDDPADIEKAKLIALQQIKDSLDSYEHDHMLMVAAYTLARQHKTDSAILFLRQISNEGLSLPGQRVFYNRCLAQLALNKGDIAQYQHYFERADYLSDSVSTNEVQRQLLEVEAKYDNEALKYQALKYKSFWLTSLLLAALIVSVLAILLMVIRKKAATRKRQLQEGNDAIERIMGDTARLTSQLRENQMMSEDLKQVIRNQIDVFTRLVEQHYLKFAHAPKKFSELFHQSYSINGPESTFWTGLRAYADSTCGGIITHMVTECPELSESDVNFLSLYCCDLPTTIIMACMGYNEVHSVYNKKRRIAEALQLDGSLDDYIQYFRTEAPSSLSIPSRTPRSK